jgi:hypothetical protein
MKLHIIFKIKIKIIYFINLSLYLNKDLKFPWLNNKQILIYLYLFLYVGVIDIYSYSFISI